MRKTLWRLLTNFALATAGWAPAILIAAWGTNYIVNCVQTLTAPGVPIEYHYDSEVGTMVVRADSYQFDLSKMKGSALRAKLFDPSGEEVVSSEAIDFAIVDGVYVIGLRDPSLRVKRLTDGSFDILRMLPKQTTEEASKVALRFSTDVAAVQYSDQNVDAQPLDVTLTNVAVESSDGAAVFRATISGDVEGKFAGTFSEEGKLYAALEVDRYDAAVPLPYIRSFLDRDSLGEFADVQAASLVVDGKAQVWWSEDSTKFAGDLRVEAAGLRTRDTLRGTTLVASIKGDGENAKVAGRADQPGFEMTFDGNVGLGDHIRLVGSARASAANRAALPPQLRGLVDPDVDFDGASYDGFLDTDFVDYFIDGSFSLAQATYAGETVTNAGGRVRVSPKNVFVKVDQGDWGGVGFSGTVGIDFATSLLSGGLQTERGRIEPLAQHFGIDQLHGLMTANAVLGGTVDKPSAEIYGRGSAGLQLGDGPMAYLGVYELRGRLDQEGLFLERLVSSGPNGVITAKGSMMWDDGALDLGVVGGGLDLSAANESLDGLAFFNAGIKGTRERPEATGRVEVYGLEVYGRGVPQLVADWTADADKLNVERVSARAGTGQIDGSATVAWDDRSIQGQFGGTDLRLEEWVAKEVIGSINVEDGLIAGTLDEPRISARLKGSKLFAGAVDIDLLDVSLQADEKGIYSDSILARSDSGELKGTGRFEFESKTGALDANVTDFSLASLPLGEYSLALDGLADAKLHLAFNDQRLLDSNLSVDVEMVNVNGTPVGRGTIDATYDGKVVGADAQIGSLERYILLSGGRYDTDSRQIAGEIDVFDILFQDIYEAFGDLIEGLPSDVKDIFANTTGLARAGVDLSGPLDDPDVVVRSFNLADLTLRGRTGGELSVQGSRHQGLWNLQSFAWKNGETLFSANGTITEDGTYDLAGSMKAMPVSWISALFPTFPVLAGRIDIDSFDLSGVKDDIQGDVTLRAEGLGSTKALEGQTFGTGWVTGPNDAPEHIQLSIANRSISISGRARYGTFDQPAFRGFVEGEIPFSSLYQKDGELAQPMTLIVRLAETGFKDFAAYFPLLDAEKSQGTVTGTASLVGVVGGEFSTEAHLFAKGDALALQQQETVLRNVDLSAMWMDGRVEIDGAFDGELGGKGSVDLNATFPDLFSESLRTEDILNRTIVSGSVDLQSFSTRFLLPTAERASRAVVTTEDLRVSGTAASPHLSGRVHLADLFIRLPQQLEENASPVIYLVDPVFDGVVIDAAEGSLLDSGAARIYFFGTGRLDGSLQNPDIAMPLTVSGGTFEMPTARITLESGGSIAIGYRGILGSPPVARVDLDLEGHTTISARRVENEYETYFVQLYIRGNLLGEEGLNISASSDPPDLSSEQVMAILGQKELVENIARSGSGIDIRETLYTAALPTTSTNVLSSLARDFGLDYISLDYNPFDGPVVGIGKTLTRGLMLQASRQLSPNPGERLKYDLQLTYRLPMQDAFFSRVRLSLGLDEMVPWRIRINWGKRF